MNDLIYSSEVRNEGGVDWLYETWTDENGAVMRFDCRRIEPEVQVSIELVETHATGDYTYISEKVTDAAGVWLRERWVDAAGGVHMERNTRFQYQDSADVEPIETHQVGDQTYTVEKFYEYGGVWLRERWTDANGNVNQESARRF